MTRSWCGVRLRATCLVAALVLVTSCSADSTSTPSAIQAAPEAGASWDHVALGDSLVPGRSYVTYYAEYLEADLGVEVRLRNCGKGGADERGTADGTLEGSEAAEDDQ